MLLPIQSDVKIYDNIKVTMHDEFDVKAYADAKFDNSRPLLIVRHRHGKKEKQHWHITGILTADTHQAPHPDKQGGGKGCKPIQKKSKELYDFRSFDYCLKPKEAAHDDVVVYTNLSFECIEKCIARSAAYHAGKASAIPDIIDKCFPGQYEDAATYHSRVIVACLDHLAADDTQPGPWLTHRVRLGIFKKHKRFHPYVASLYK